MSITITEKPLLPVRRDGQVGTNSGGGTMGGGGNMPLSPLSTTKTIIPFTTTATPTISNYQTTYSISYGQYPNLRLIWVDGDGNWNEWMQAPKFTLSAGVVDSISWDLGEELTGFIILN